MFNSAQEPRETNLRPTYVSRRSCRWSRPNAECLAAPERRLTNNSSGGVITGSGYAVGGRSASGVEAAHAWTGWSTVAGGPIG